MNPAFRFSHREHRLLSFASPDIPRPLPDANVNMPREQKPTKTLFVQVGAKKQRAAELKKQEEESRNEENPDLMLNQHLTSFEEGDKKQAAERVQPLHIRITMELVSDFLRSNSAPEIGENLHNYLARRSPRELSEIHNAFPMVMPTCTADQRALYGESVFVNICFRQGTNPIQIVESASQLTVSQDAMRKDFIAQVIAEEGRMRDRYAGVTNIESLSRETSLTAARFTRQLNVTSGGAQKEIRQSFPIRMNMPDVTPAGQNTPVSRMLEFYTEERPGGNPPTVVRHRWQNRTQ